MINLEEIFTLEDTFHITGRGKVLAGRLKIHLDTLKPLMNETFIQNGLKHEIIGIETFAKTYPNGYKVGEYLGLLVKNK